MAASILLQLFLVGVSAYGTDTPGYTEDYLEIIDGSVRVKYNLESDG